jgi:hypothetical protein
VEGQNAMVMIRDVDLECEGERIED